MLHGVALRPHVASLADWGRTAHHSVVPTSLLWRLLLYAFKIRTLRVFLALGLRGELHASAPLIQVFVIQLLATFYQITLPGAFVQSPPPIVAVTIVVNVRNGRKRREPEDTMAIEVSCDFDCAIATLTIRIVLVDGFVVFRPFVPCIFHSGFLTPSGPLIGFAIFLAALPKRVLLVGHLSEVYSLMGHNGKQRTTSEGWVEQHSHPKLRITVRSAFFRLPFLGRQRRRRRRRVLRRLQPDRVYTTRRTILCVPIRVRVLATKTFRIPADEAAQLRVVVAVAVVVEAGFGVVLAARVEVDVVVGRAAEIKLPPSVVSAA